VAHDQPVAQHGDDVLEDLLAVVERHEARERDPVVADDLTRQLDRQWQRRDALEERADLGGGLTGRTARFRRRDPGPARRAAARTRRVRARCRSPSSTTQECGPRLLSLAAVRRASAPTLGCGRRSGFLTPASVPAKKANGGSLSHHSMTRWRSWRVGKRGLLPGWIAIFSHAPLAS
jgi:hypothetical protein